MAVSALTALIGPAVNNRLIDRERDWTAAERDKTKAANDQLKVNLRLAMEALDDVSLRLAQDRLGRDPRQLQEDDDLLKKALAFYERFAEQNSDDPDVRFDDRNADDSVTGGPNTGSTSPVGTPTSAPQLGRIPLSPLI